MERDRTANSENWYSPFYKYKIHSDKVELMNFYFWVRKRREQKAWTRVQKRKWSHNSRTTHGR